MKKLLSVFLSVLMALMCVYPAFAADNEVLPAAEQNSEKYNVTFAAPSEEYKDGYVFAVSVNGEVQFEEDPDGEYCFFDDRYMYPSNVLPSYQDRIPPERYSPVEYSGTIEAEYGDTIAFQVVTSEKYNVYTAVVFVNGSPISLNAYDEYAVYVDRDLDIRVAEKDENNNEVLLRNHYNVKLTSGDGYKVKTLKGENYNVVYYGGDFYFRVQVSNGYTASGIKVSVYRGSSVLGGFLDEEDGDMLIGIMGGAETLTSYGIDEDGCRLYKIENITTDCRVIVSGVQEESSAGIMAFFKRILRLLLNLLGIEADILGSITSYYTVSIDASNTDGVTYQVIRSSSDDISPTQFNVTSGEGVTIIVTKKDLNQDVRVSWSPGNEFGTYATDWVLDYDTITGEVSYVAVYNIDNISADTRIVIS